MMRDYCLIQLTDLHLQPDPAALLHGVNTEQRLQQALASLAGTEADALVLTGDLAHIGNVAAYNRLIDYLSPVTCPAYWLPGNHDDAALMQQLATGSLRQKQFRLGNWQILLLDTTAEPDGVGGGEMAAGELAWLQQQLAQAEQDSSIDHLLLAMHHHPVPVGSAWQDRIMLRNAGPFWQQAEQSRKLRAVIFGHVHQDNQLQHQSVALYSSPSVAAQFEPRCEQFTLGPEGPGYCCYRLSADGRVERRLVRLTELAQAPAG
ncbi:metallophosphoesterase [Marinobacterium jannaschii]|uniref:metallophosphoesterase n=1 Tax=Marinobacterium jannaschii TaxID=64970 RepID=UPI0004855FD9|nr:metallophosphoesterase [Marinobacterium jannaschii]